MGMDIDTWRKERGYHIADLLEPFGVDSVPTMRRYAIGEVWPPDDVVDRILLVTDGAVDVFAMRRRRQEWLRANGRWRVEILSPAAIAEARDNLRVVRSRRQQAALDDESSAGWRRGSVRGS